MTNRVKGSQLAVMIVFIFTLMLISCSKEDNSTDNNPEEEISTIKDINGTIETTSIIPAGATASAYYNNDAASLMSKGTIVNKNFTLTLVTPTGQLSEELLDIIDFVTPPAGITVSDHNTRVMEISIDVMNGTNQIGYLQYSTLEDVDNYIIGDVEVFYVYSDRVCTIKGTYSDDYHTYVCDFKLLKGWNKVAVAVTGNTANKITQTYSNTMPTGLKWWML